MNFIYIFFNYCKYKKKYNIKYNFFTLSIIYLYQINYDKFLIFLIENELFTIISIFNRVQFMKKT
jgi:hypothetical protein